MRLQSRRRRAGIMLLIVLVGILAYVLARPHAIPDWFRLYGYEPPQAIVDIATATSMTDQARHLFYINRPELSDKQAFRKNCPQYDEQTIVIGCYLSGQRGIYLLSVEDPRLDGVEEVTAAHEMLHAAYERLGDAERSRIDALLQQYANDELRNERILQALKGYEKSEPGQALNEMHSMFGTEIANLPDELETYYAQYFSDRRQVVTATDKYQAAFTTRQSQIKAYDAQLETLSDQIKVNTQHLNASGQAIEQDREALDNYRRSGNIEAYNNGVQPFNAKVNDYNSLLTATKELIEHYNRLVIERNAIAAQTVELQQAIDSSDLPQKQ